VSEHPYDPASAELTPMLLVAVTIGYGAAYFREVDHGTASGWITSNPSPVPIALKLAFVGQGWSDFPSTAVVTTDQLRVLVAEYLATGRRPASVRWQESEWVQ